VAAVLYLNGTYQEGFAVLLIPALIAIAILLIARWLYPRPRDLEIRRPEFQAQGMTTVYWFYLVAIALIAAGYADFPLIAYHFEKNSVLSKNLIPISYAIAMGVDALAALLFGYLYDRIGPLIIIIASSVASLFAPLVFLGGFYGAFIGMGLWGIGLAAQESVMRSFVADLISPERRGSAYGFFNALYGTTWFLGSALMGILYDTSVVSLVFFSVAMQVVSLPLLFTVFHRYPKTL
jgi:predicted MFS family arabinose efflux permease